MGFSRKLEDGYRVRHDAAAQLPLPTIHNNPMLEEFFDDDLVKDEPFSMFKVVRIPPLDEIRVRQLRQGVSGMKQRPRKRKNRAHEVDEFYRWQPYGPGRKLRRWQKVKGHPRGQGAPKSVMNVLLTGNRIAY